MVRLVNILFPPLPQHIHTVFNLPLNKAKCLAVISAQPLDRRNQMTLFGRADLGREKYKEGKKMKLSRVEWKRRCGRALLTTALG